MGIPLNQLDIGVTQLDIGIHQLDIGVPPPIHPFSAHPQHIPRMPTGLSTAPQAAHKALQGRVE
jgi:hypothetical protein